MNLKPLSQKRKGQQFGLSALPYVAISIVVLVVILALNSLIFTEIGDSNIIDASVSNNTTDILGKGSAGMQTFADQIDLLVIGVVLVVILGIIVGALYWLQRRSGAGV